MLMFWYVLFFFVSGSGEVARRATSLGPKPSLFVLVSLVLFCFLFLLFVFFFVLEGLRLTWP